MRDAIPESGLGLLKAIPAHRMQEAIVVGEGVTVPMRIRFDDLEPDQQPRSGAVSFAKALRKDIVKDGFVAETVTRWRHQTREPIDHSSM